MSKKILICGDRNWTNKEIIKRELELFDRDTVIIHGACRGADSWGGYIAYKLGFKDIRSYPAKWRDEEGRFRKWAGPERNQEMLDKNPDIELVLAFHEDIWRSKGTKDMIERAKKANIEVKLRSK
jgi:hypothetical protein